MKFTILLPHYKVWKMTAYTVSQLIKLKGQHEIQIIIIDNSPEVPIPNESFRHLLGHPDITLIANPPGRMQSHGIAFNMALPLVMTDYFITIESDSFPTRDNWLDSYENLINAGYNAAGSMLTLSGGQYMHPAGAMYKWSDWEEASRYCEAIPYTYFPNMGMKDTFPCHLMVKNDILDDFVKDPFKYGVTLHHSYLGLSAEEITKKAKDYAPVRGVFHNGMGSSQESFFTYAKRNLQSEPSRVLPDGTESVIYRMGFEPGQWFCYWLLANNRRVFSIPTYTEWMPNRENQQQEFTIMDNGFRHIWGVSAYSGASIPELADIVSRKNQVVDELYNSL